MNHTDQPLVEEDKKEDEATLSMGKKEEDANGNNENENDNDENENYTEYSQSFDVKKKTSIDEA